MTIAADQLTQFRSTVYLGLGSNLDDPPMQIAHALRAIDDMAGVALVKVSSLYRSAPLGMVDQPAFVNAVAQVETILSPADLMHGLLEVERVLHRVRTAKNGPRSIDLDILIFNEWRLDEPQLTIPHPRLHQRAFALLPLLEVSPKIYIPGLGFASDYLPSVRDQQIERLIESDPTQQ